VRLVLGHEFRDVSTLLPIRSHSRKNDKHSFKLVLYCSPSACIVIFIYILTECLRVTTCFNTIQARYNKYIGKDYAKYMKI
jgi:hypothetical protein